MLDTDDIHLQKYALCLQKLNFLYCDTYHNLLDSSQIEKYESEYQKLMDRYEEIEHNFLRSENFPQVQAEHIENICNQSMILLDLRKHYHICKKRYGFLIKYVHQIKFISNIFVKLCTPPKYIYERVTNIAVI